MSSIFDLKHADHLIERIARLTPESKGQWGKMFVDQMLAHCQQPLRVAVGELKPKRSFIGLLIGPTVKKKLVSTKPWDKDMPTDKNFIILDRRKFDEERRKLTELVRRFRRRAGRALQGTASFLRQAHHEGMGCAYAEPSGPSSPAVRGLIVP